MINKLWIVYDYILFSMETGEAKQKALSDIFSVINYLEGVNNE